MPIHKTAICDHAQYIDREYPNSYTGYNFGVLQGLQAAGVQVTAQMFVTGFDNIVFSAYINPPLTTFDQPKRFIGAEAARLLLELLQSPASDGASAQPKVRMLKGRLLVRASTTVPPP